MTTPAEKVTKLIIDRKKWARGTGGSELLQADGKMCCLGFYAKALGYTDDEILYRSTPNEAVRHHPEHKDLFPAWLHDLDITYDGDTMVCNILMKDNDKDPCSESEREAAIAKTFKEAGGVDVEFVG